MPTTTSASTEAWADEGARPLLPLPAVLLLGFSALALLYLLSA